MSIPSNPTSRAGGYYPAPEKLAALRSKVMGDPEQMAAGRSKVIMGEMLNSPYAQHPKNHLTNHAEWV